MDLVCNLSQWAGCYQAIQNQAKTSKMMNPTGTGPDGALFGQRDPNCGEGVSLLSGQKYTVLNQDS